MRDSVSAESQDKLKEENERLSEQLAENVERPRAEGEESAKVSGFRGR